MNTMKLEVGDKVGFKMFTKGEGTLVGIKLREDSNPRIRRYAIHTDTHKSAVYSPEFKCKVVWVEQGNCWPT